MTQAQTTTTTTTPTNGNGKQARVPTAIEAITKISKNLDQLSPSDRKRVLAFVNENNTSAE